MVKKGQEMVKKRKRKGKDRKTEERKGKLRAKKR